MQEAVYKRALAKGCVYVAYSRVMLLGPAGVGKTSLKRSLMKLPWKPDTCSTAVIHIDTGISIHEDNNWKTTDMIEELIQPKATSLELENETVFAESFQDTHIKPALSYFYFWDCGGQPSFLEILPAFLTSRTFFILTFNASIDLNTNWQSVVHIEDRRIDHEEVNVTTLDYMLNWMSNIHSHLMVYNEDKGVSDYPRMYCIGTHGDCVTSHRKFEIKQELESHYRQKAYSVLVEDSMIVDNTSSGRGRDEDPSLGMLRNALLEFTRNKLVKKTPLSWFHFYRSLQVCAESVINLESVYTIATANEISVKDVPCVLTFYHNLGALLYYPQLGSLKDVIIINAKFFLNALAKIFPLPVIYAYENAPGYSDEWRLFREFGILVQPLYFELWHRNLKPSIMIEALLHFLLAVEVKTDKYPPPSKQYFMPLILKSACDEIKLISMSADCFQAAPVHITFSSGFVPPGFFTRFVVAVARNPKIKLYFEKGVYRNHVTFRYQDPRGTSIEHILVTDLNNVIGINVHHYHAPGSLALEKIYQDILIVLKDSAQEVEVVLEKCAEEWAIDENSFKYVVKYDFQYTCTSCPVSSLCHYLITAPTNPTSMSPVYCQKIPDKYRPLSDHEKVWFQDAIKVIIMTRYRIIL